jgi:hypothetical protein
MFDGKKVSTIAEIESLGTILPKKLLKTNFNSNPNIQYIILYDSVLNIEELKQIIKEYNPQIITFSLESHNFLVKNSIDHKLSESYLNENELDSIQDHLYLFTQWYSDPSISKLIEYDGINIGELFYFEFGHFLIPILKKIYEIMRITAVYKNTLFFSSNSLIIFLKLFTLNIQVLNDNPIHKISSPSNNILKFNKKILINNNKNSVISKIIKISYSLFKIIFQNKKFEHDNPTIFLINHTTKRFQTVLEKLPDFSINLVKYDAVIPAFWDIDSFLMIKKSNCHIEHSTTIPPYDTREHNSLLDKQLNNLFEEEFFNKFFSVDNVSFWDVIKENFSNMYKRTYLNSIKDIEKIKFLFKKYPPSYILILGENSPLDLIIIKIAQKMNTKVGMLQHAFNTDNPHNSDFHGIKYDHFCRLVPLYSDHFLVWDKLTQENAIKQGVNSKKIIPIGCPFFDTFFHDDKNSKNDYILLAIAPSTGNNTTQLSTQMQLEFENTIKQICQIITKMNKKLLIKIHHASTFDEKTIKKINPNIVVKRTGSFYQYAKDCELLICIDMSTAILDAMLLKKPIISVLIADKDSPSTIFQKNYVLKTTMENFEKTLIHSLDDKFKIFCIAQGEKFIHNYMLNHGTSTKSLLNFLSNIFTKTIN